MAAQDASAAIQYALAQLGKPYQFGAAGSSAFDCSGLILAAYKQVGIKLPHKAALQQEYGYEVGLGGAKPGDLVFFQGGPTAMTNKNGLYIGHVGIYVGNGYVLEAYSSKDKVRIRQIGSRNKDVVSVKRLVTPLNTSITVPGSPWTPSSGPQAQSFTIPGTGSTLIPSIQGATASSGPQVHPATFTNNEVPPKRKPAASDYLPTVAQAVGASSGTFTGNEVPPQVGAAPYSPITGYSGGPLSDNQLVQVLYTAGFRGEELITAFAIAKRESNGDPTSFNGNTKTGDKSYGLFQVNMLGSMGPARLAQFGLSSNEDLFDPLTNARVAYQMAHRTSTPFYDWGPYKGRAATYGTNVAYARNAVSTAIQNGVANMPWTGAATTGGDTTAYTDTNPTADPNVTAQQLYGWMAAYLNDPTIGPLLQRAANEQWDPAKLQVELMRTSWWQTTQASIREWDANAAQDPATAQSQIDQRMAEMQDKARSMGASSIDPARLRDMAEQSLRMGWGAAQIEDAIGSEIMRDPTLMQTVGQGQTGRDVDGTAYQYGVMLSDEAKNQWAAQIAAGQSTSDDFTRWAITQAKSYYNSPDLSSALDRGVTVRQYADPYITLAANTLGVSTNDIDIRDPKYMKSIAYVDPNGARRPMNLDEWGRTLRSDPVYNYSKTDQAKANAYAVVRALSQAFGTAA